MNLLDGVVGLNFIVPIFPFNYALVTCLPAVGK